MSFQPIEEKQAERSLIIRFARDIGAKIIRLQDDNDDGSTDGVIEIDNKEMYVEVRRKGYPNHRGKVCSFKDGWNTSFLLRDGGIYLNERTIKQYINIGFIYVVDIKGFEYRAAFINISRVDMLLKQQKRMQKSTNSGVMQHVKYIPLQWFKEIGEFKIN